MIRLLLLCLLSALLMSPAFADGGRERKGKYDDSELYDARRQGEVLPLDEILRKLERFGVRQVLEIENEFDDGRNIYEIYFLDAQGRRGEVEVDASTGAVIEFEKDD